MVRFYWIVNCRLISEYWSKFHSNGTCKIVITPLNSCANLNNFGSSSIQECFWNLCETDKCQTNELYKMFHLSVCNTHPFALVIRLGSETDGFHFNLLTQILIQWPSVWINHLFNINFKRMAADLADFSTFSNFFKVIQSITQPIQKQFHIKDQV